jgi:hypothetical protein
MDGLQIEQVAGVGSWTFTRIEGPRYPAVWLAGWLSYLAVWLTKFSRALFFVISVGMCGRDGIQELRDATFTEYCDDS